MKRGYFILITLITILTFVLVVPATGATCELKAPVQLTPVGHPIWKPVDFHVFTANIGTPDDGYAGFTQNQINLMYPRRHESCSELGIGPGDPHQPPYIQEMEAGLDIMNFKDSRSFSVTDFTTPNGVWAVWMVVPNPGTTGSSPDFKSGPIIPNTLFPIHGAGATYRDTHLWNSYLAAFDVPPLTPQLTCPYNVDGHSHFPVFIAETSSFGPGGLLTGRYEFRITMMDVSGNGWSITVKFTVLDGK
jgi:hypothetical protein